MWAVHGAVGDVLDAASQLSDCNEITDDLFQLIEYSDIWGLAETVKHHGIEAGLVMEFFLP